MGGSDKDRAFLATWEKVAVHQRLGAKEGQSPNCCEVILSRVSDIVKGSGEKMTTSPNFHVMTYSGDRWWPKLAIRLLT